ncbi:MULTISPECIES: 3-oxoacyl-ACP synthase [Burkholderia]|uniref:3-oxoacyl-[acyl-carrier-protein] synthase III n=1 Tax=Burkholderia pyrrocinia TaxID=60550 RepID=A0A318HXW5_BURPY|nr:MULTISPECIES: 3-oxoacyl-ACP synthase [Burkholderia]PXX23113.1 3-oxoacyl-[acyl-carrier-protein] synthase III [Burkholderia pyrrocinia]SFW88834.1 3-oxoacyl-[acyl-carrier-protein] synthase III [Burkholderia sp. NFACC33-1]SFY46193.1 3-oxoacyl-[acyl-carrier-protein] synthase III [Burkholderia sp. NFPP32]
MQFGIPYVAYYLPDQVNDVRHWGRITGQSDATITRLEQAGVRCFHDAAGQTALSLATNAIKTLLDTGTFSSDTIDCLVYVHTLQGSIAPPPLSLPQLLCKRFGFVKAAAFSLAQQHCASSLGALRIIRAMLIARPVIDRVLLVGADVMPIDIDRRIEAAGLLSDGAFAALVERDARVNRVLALASHATGNGWRGTLGQGEPRFAAQYFLAARQLIKRVADEAHVPLAEVQRVLPSHLDLPAWRRIVESLGLASTCLFVDNFPRVAHVTVSDPFINLADCHDLMSGKSFLLFAQGVGGFSAAALLMR